MRRPHDGLMLAGAATPTAKRQEPPLPGRIFSRTFCWTFKSVSAWAAFVKSQTTHSPSCKAKDCGVRNSKAVGASAFVLCPRPLSRTALPAKMPQTGLITLIHRSARTHRSSHLFPVSALRFPLSPDSPGFSRILQESSPRSDAFPPIHLVTPSSVLGVLCVLGATFRPIFNRPAPPRLPFPSPFRSRPIRSDSVGFPPRCQVEPGDAYGSDVARHTEGVSRRPIQSPALMNLNQPPPISLLSPKLTQFGLIHLDPPMPFSPLRSPPAPAGRSPLSKDSPGFSRIHLDRFDSL